MRKLKNILKKIKSFFTGGTISDLINSSKEGKSAEDNYNIAHELYNKKYKSIEEEQRDIFIKKEQRRIKKIIEDNECGKTTTGTVIIPLGILIFTFEIGIIEGFSDKIKEILSQIEKKSIINNSYVCFLTTTIIISMFVILLIVMVREASCVRRNCNKITLCHICLEALEDVEKENHSNKTKKIILKKCKQMKKFLGI